MDECTDGGGVDGEVVNMEGRVAEGICVQMVEERMEVEQDGGGYVEQAAEGGWSAT